MARQNVTTRPSPSRFIERLREVSRGPVGRIGFGTTQPKQPPSLLLVARLPRNEAALAEAAAQAGADAVIASVLGPGPGEMTFGSLAEERKAIAAIVKAVGQTPVGVAVGPSGDVDARDFDALAELGVDFVSIHPHRAPVQLLQTERLGRVMRLDSHYASGPLRGLNEIEVHAFEIVPERPEGSIEDLSLHDLAAYRQLADSARRPILCAVEKVPGEGVLSALRSLGVEAVVCSFPADVEAATLEKETASLRKAVDSLGAPIGRGLALGEATVVLPRIGARPLEEEDEDDDY